MEIAMGIFLGLSMFALATCASMALIGSAAMNEQAKVEAAAVAEFQSAVRILIHSVGSDNYTSAPNKKLIAKHCNPASDA